ncbi:MAG: hypothetical protein K8S25_08425 [Alphaproteobacteria bacterium]|nr:hypothetical protein [Alphaproteobacteria bacterium]
MAMFGSSKFDPNESPSGRAHHWGRRGVEVTATLLRNWLGAHTENSLRLRAENLNRRVYGPGAVMHHGSAVALGLAVFVTALFVDYNIIHEFWARALSNEFGEVPPALATTVAAKSLQVVFATLAVHYLISNIGHGGRVAYSLLIFLVTAMMVIGIGLLWANNSLPAGSKVFGLDVNDSAQQIDQFMKGLGIAPPRKAALPAEVKALKKYELLIWLGSLGVIFLVVASIGAMALHTAMRGFAGMTGGALYDNHKEARHGNRVRDELRQAQLDLKHLQNDEGGFVQAKLSEFISVYTEGVVSARHGNSRQNYLLRRANESAEEVSSSWSGFGSSGPGNVDNLDDYRNRKVAQS